VILNGSPPDLAAKSGILAAFKALQENLPEEEVRRCLEKVEGGKVDLLLQLLRLSARLSEPGQADRLADKDAAALLQLVDNLAATLRLRAPLLVPKVCFCRKIKAFGLYDPLPPNPRFEAGVDRLRLPGERVLVYVEVRNFANRDLGRHMFQTSLTPRLEIYECRLMRRRGEPGEADSAAEAPGQGLEGRPTVVINQFRSRNEDSYSLTPRNELILGLEFNIPHGMPPGSYLLRVEVRDDIGLDPATGKPRVAHASAYFQVVANGTTPPHSPMAEGESGKAGE
jgi:hypothetical protein